MEQTPDSPVVGPTDTPVVFQEQTDVSSPIATVTDPSKPTQFDSELTIAFKDVSYHVQVPLESADYQTFISPLVNAVKAVGTMGKSLATRTFHRVQDISGLIKPGTLSLVISPPGHGKSTYLKVLANRLVPQEGKVAYNGRDMNTAAAEGADLRKMTQYVDQVDAHMALLSVQETIEFAHRMSSKHYDQKRVTDTIELLGLNECKDTILGNAFIRGVSGGQRRRVTIGEMLVSDASVLFLDEFTNGLDTATSEDIARGLKQWCRKTNGSIVCTLQQPTPGLYETFDEIVILREGQVVFHGPRENVIPYFDAMGYHCPDDVDLCDFIIDVLSQPRLVIDRQRENAKKLTRKDGKSSPAPAPASDVLLDGTRITPAASPCITTEQMVNFFKSTKMWTDMKQQLDEVFPEDKKVDVSKFPSLMPTPQAQEKYQVGEIMSIFAIFGLVFQRHFKLFFRDKQLVMPRVFNVIFMGLVYGSLYWNIGKDEFFLRVAVLLISLTQVAFGNMVELPIAVGYNRVALKQMAARFYPAWSYVAAAAMTSVPLFLIEVIIFSNIMYWMAGNYADAGRYFTHFAVVFTQSFNMSVWFRFLSAIGKDEAQAQSMAGPSTGIFMVFGGFFVTLSNMPEWMRWAFWISPFSWSVRALANTEFLSARYDEITDGVRLGHKYLSILDMEIGMEWVGYCILYLVGLSLFIMVLHTLVITQPYHELSIGTRRTDEEEMLDSDLDKEGEGAIRLHSMPAAEGGDVEEDEADNAAPEPMEREVSSQSLVRDASSFNQNTLQTLREALPFHPTWLSFSNVKYTVQVTIDGETRDKVLLDGVSGYAEPGKLTALMGASGAGKTTLLDVLAGRKSMGVIEGNIMLNGHKPTAADFANITGYVEQFDSLLAFDTVRETLQFAARLRLPASVSDEVKEKIVDEILEILDLAPIQNYLIGNERIPGLSPSQLKRVNIGVELVANPSVLFLDEPTTGLDSKAAQTVMRVVRRIARSGRSVVCTIHQPSAELFYLFDRLVLLGSGGHQIYFGDLGNRSSKFIKYLSNVAGVKPIPFRYNPASWMLEELGVGVASLKEDTGDSGPKESQAEMIQRFKKHYFQSRTARRTMARLHALETLSGVEESIEYSVSRAAIGESDKQQSYSVSVAGAALPTAASTIQQRDMPSLFYQWKQLQARSFVSYWRNPPFLFSRMFVVTIISLIFGCIYFGLEVTSQTNVVSAIAARVISINFGGVTHGATALPVFMNNRAVFYRERASGMYNPGLWAVVGFITEMFFVIFSALFAQIPVYFMVGFKNTAGAFFLYYLTVYTMCMVFISMSMLISAIAPSTPAAGVIQGMYFGFFFTFSGAFLLQISRVDGSGHSECCLCLMSLSALSCRSSMATLTSSMSTVNCELSRSINFGGVTHGVTVVPLLMNNRAVCTMTRHDNGTG